MDSPPFLLQQISGAMVNDENAEVVHHDQLQTAEAEEEEVRNHFLVLIK